MNRTIFNCLAGVILLAAACVCAGKVIYVDAGATGAKNGSSWANAYRYLQDALADADSARKPVEIRVAQGTYKPDQGGGDTPGDRHATFLLQSGVALRGGYGGFGEPDPNARDVQKHETILSGDLGGNDIELGDLEWQTVFDFLADPNRAENSYTVVTGSGTDSTAILDGFTITAGHANTCNVESNGCCTEPNSPQNNGAGMYNHAGSPTLIGCTFYRNTAQVVDCGGASGGGIFNSSSNPTLRNCRFIENVVFGGNWASHGGAMYNIDSNPILSSCLFRGNIAMGYDSEYDGGAISDVKSNSALTDCSFIENLADWGGAIFNSNGSPTITRCTFIGNRVNDNGGAICMAGGRPTLTNCTFRDNRAHTFGGAICSSASSYLVVTGSTFASNHAADGGAIYSNFRDNIALQGCTFKANSASRGGAVASEGAWYNDPNSSTLVTNCTFSGNSAYQGGGLHAGWNKRLTVSNCVFEGNRSVQCGGGFYGDGSLVFLANCTFAENWAQKGSSLACDWEPCIVRMRDCILWDGGSEIFDAAGSTIDVTYSDVQGGWPGEGNINADPCFARPGYRDSNGTGDDPNDDFWLDGDYHLKSQAGRWEPATRAWIRDEVTSLCIDTGDPMSPVGLEPFANGGRINMGAYGGTAQASKSYFGAPVCEMIVAGDVNGDCRVDFADFEIMALHWLEER